MRQIEEYFLRIRTNVIFWKNMKSSSKQMFLTKHFLEEKGSGTYLQTSFKHWFSQKNLFKTTYKLSNLFY